MFRPLAIIVAAILLAHPSMNRQQATYYAKALQREAVEHHFDPFTGVSLIRRESRWHPSAVSPDGEDYGLAQIRARYIGACRADEDPVHAPSEACLAVKRSLLNGAYNIRVMATLITRNRELCKDKTGTARFGQWLASYEGRNYPGRDAWCQAAKQTEEVIQYRRWLIAKLVPKPKPAPAAVATCPASGRKRGKHRVAAASDKSEQSPGTPRSSRRSSRREAASKHRSRPR